MKWPSGLFITTILSMSGVMFGQLLTQQSPATSSEAQALAILQAANVALTGGLTVSDVTLDATAVWTAGDTSEQGTARLRVKGADMTRLDISAGAVMRSEIRNDSSIAAGQWIGPDSRRHWMAPHNCWIPAGVLVPHSLIPAISHTAMKLTYLGQETRNGVLVDHIRVRRTSNENSSFVNGLVTRLSRTDVYLDATSHLLAAVTFAQPIDSDTERSLPGEIDFSDYRRVSGILVPFQISRQIGTIVLQLSITTVNVNSGLADSEFALE